MGAPSRLRRLCLTLALAGLALQTAAASPRARDWADGKDVPGQPDYAVSRGICRCLKSRAVPPTDAPDAATAAGLADCSSEALYYGIGRPADPQAARFCAFVEKQAADPQVEDYGFTGDRTLMEVYANGLGAPRDLDLATALACRTGFAPAEIDARVRHLARLKADHWTGTAFSLCDDVTGGLMVEICADHRQLVARAARAKALAALMAGWGKDERAAFATLARAEAAAVDAHGENEVDQTGSGRAALVMAAEDEGEAAFLALLADAEAGRLPPATDADAKAADDRLDARHRALLARAALLFRGATITANGLASAERAWLRLRDAWLVFAKLKYPALAPSTLRLRLDRDRMAELDALAVPR